MKLFNLLRNFWVKVFLLILAGLLCFEGFYNHNQNRYTGMLAVIAIICLIVIDYVNVGKK